MPHLRCIYRQSVFKHTSVTITVEFVLGRCFWGCSFAPSLFNYMLLVSLSIMRSKKKRIEREPKSVPVPLSCNFSLEDVCKRDGQKWKHRVQLSLPSPTLPFVRCSPVRNTNGCLSVEATHLASKQTTFIWPLNRAFYTILWFLCRCCVCLDSQAWIEWYFIENGSENIVAEGSLLLAMYRWWWYSVLVNSSGNE